MNKWILFFWGGGGGGVLEWFFFLVFLISTRYKATLSAMKKCDFIRGVTSLDWDNLVVFYYLSASGIWPDKKGGLWWEGPYKKGGLWWEGPYKKGGLWWEGPYKKETTVFPIWKEYGVCADYALYNPELFIIFKIYFSVHYVYVLKALFQEIHSHKTKLRFISPTHLSWF